MFTEAEIAKFQELYLSHYAITLTKEESTRYGMELIRLVQAVMGSSAKI